MRGLAGFIMAGRLKAALVAASFAVLALIFAPTMILSGAAVALVTLRRGPREGLVVAGAGALGSAVLAGLALGSPFPALWLVSVFWLPMWLIAIVLRNTVSLQWTLQAMGALTALGVVSIFVALGNPVAWWRDILGQILMPILVQSGVPESTISSMIDVTAPLMTGVLVGNLALTLLMSLLLARFWQARLYNPGGFGQEFRALRLGRSAAIATLALAALATMTRMPLAVNVALALAGLVAVHGLAVVHGAIDRAKASRGWLFGLYAALFVFLPEVVVLMCLVSVLDAWLDLRGRVPAR